MQTDQSKHGQIVTFAQSCQCYFLMPLSVFPGGCNVPEWKDKSPGERHLETLLTYFVAVILRMWTWLRFVELSLIKSSPVDGECVLMCDSGCAGMCACMYMYVEA